MKQDQQSQLKVLIAKGKEQGYLTYREVNDHLPSDIVDPEQIEDIIRMINELGITVHEVAPDKDDVQMSDAVASDEDTNEAAAAALATVDSDFGRTTDPVRMYMREMGTVELLTREGEIKIAKRIEAGQKQQMMALAAYPSVIVKLLKDYELVTNEEMRLTDLITGFVDPEAEDIIKSPGGKPEAKNDDEEEEDTGPDPEEARTRFLEIKKLHKKMMTALAKTGVGDKKTEKLREQIVECFMLLKLTPKMSIKLVQILRDVVERIRSQERVIMSICVNKAHMPRRDSIL